MPRNDSKRRKINKNGSNHPKIDKEEEIETLTNRIETESPAPGTGFTPNPSTGNPPFTSLPISSPTILGLTKDSKTIMTDIQSACIPHALAGRDILASARTGSGKTLAFLTPLLETLYRNRISSAIPSLSALILSPTRELATQTFGVLRTVGCNHGFSTLLLIGGRKEFAKERTYVGRTNIIVATPGRLLQHLEQSPDLDCSYLEVLVLDEADRILDMGFAVQLNRILEYLPTERQTMLFSATQTKRVKDLSRLSLHKPEYIFVHSGEKKGDGEGAQSSALSSIPSNLQQMYIVTPLHHKLDLIYSFLKSHLQNRIILFFSTCSQVRHAHALFCALRPGVPLLCIHGKMKQERRLSVYEEFLRRSKDDSSGCVLIATDLVARGLDFPNVHWVVMGDAPESREEYVHRVGRTARYTSKGRSLLLLLPQEEKGFNEILEDAGITVKKWGMNPERAIRVSTAKVAGGIAARDGKVAELARKAFMSYLRSYVLMPRKDIFDVDKLDTDEYGMSLGLGKVPNLRFLGKFKNVTREDRREVKNRDRRLDKLKEEIRAEKLGVTIEDMNNRNKKRKEQDDPDDMGGLLVKKQQLLWDDGETTMTDTSISDSKKNKSQRIDIHSNSNNKIRFDDDGEEQQSLLHVAKSEATGTSSGRPKYDLDDLAVANEQYLETVRARLEKTKDLDKHDEIARVKELRQKRKFYKKTDAEEEEEEEQGAVLLGGDDDEGSSDSDDDSEKSGNGESIDSSDDDSDSDDEINMKEQEELALSLIRNN